MLKNLKIADFGQICPCAIDCSFSAIHCASSKIQILGRNVGAIDCCFGAIDCISEKFEKLLCWLGLSWLWLDSFARQRRHEPWSLLNNNQPTLETLDQMNLELFADQLWLCSDEIHSSCGTAIFGIFAYSSPENVSKKNKI